MVLDALAAYGGFKQGYNEGGKIFDKCFPKAAAKAKANLLKENERREKKLDLIRNKKNKTFWDKTKLKLLSNKN